MRENAKRGQVAIFVIIALVIVGVVLVIFLYPKISANIRGGVNPEKYLKDCISPEVKSKIDFLGKHSGYSELKEGYFVYENEKIKYLCYVSGYYKTCVVQEPMITSNFEKELSNALNGKARECVNSLVQEYKKRNYDAVIGGIGSKASIGVGRVTMSFSTPLSVTKGGEVETYSGFNIVIDSEMFELLAVAENIIEYESTLGDSETTYYLGYYPNLRIEKIKLDEGTKVYKLSNVITNEQFMFASRSLSWPPGLGLNQAYNQNG